MAAACADAAELRASIAALTEVRPLQDGTDALKTAIAEVRTDLDAVTDSASTALQPAVTEVKTAFAQLKSAVTGLTAGTLREQAPAITTALAQVQAAGVGLTTSLSKSCPGN